MDAGVYAKDSFVGECGAALALLGQSNRQIYALVEVAGAWVRD